MWKPHCALSWQANQGAMHTRKAGFSCQAGSEDAELLGNGCQNSASLSVFQGKGWEGKRWDHSCISITIGYSCHSLHKFGSRKISQDQLCHFRRQGWLEPINNYCHTINTICWARGRTELYGLWNTYPGH